MVRTWKYIDYIQSSTHDQLGIINNILDISKIETGELRLESSIKPGTTI
jgi:signal transduction histidine kinase